MTTPTSPDCQAHRRCVFALSLNRGHLVTVAVGGWYPVSVSCCGRLGGTWIRGHHLPYRL